MVELDHVAVAAAIPACAKHRAVSGRVYRRPIGSGQVDARVHGSTRMEGIGANAEAAGEADVGLDRLVGRNGDDAVLQLVELLPAVEQRLERRVAGAFERAALASVAGRVRIEAEAAEGRRIHLLVLESSCERDLALLHSVDTTVGFRG